MSNSNVQTTDLFPSRDQTYSMRVAAIEKQLNSRCCLHDSLMPLLQFNTYQSHLYRWENSFKSLNKKINDYQYYLNGLLAQNTKEPPPQLNPSDFSRISAINKIRKNIDQLRQNLNKSQKLQLQNYQTQSLLDSRQTNDQFSSNYGMKTPSNQFQRLKQQSRQSIKQLKRYVQMSLALFRNELMLSQINESNRLQNSRTLSEYSNGKQQIIQNIQKNMFYQLRKQLQTIRNGQSILDLQSFHQFTMCRLSGDAMQINQLVLLLYPSDPSLNLSQSQAEQIIRQLEILEQKVKLFNWQIKGLKKKYLSELNYKYLNENEPFEVNILEKKMVKDLNTLDNAYIQLKSKIQYLKKDLLKK